MTLVEHGIERGLWVWDGDGERPKTGMHAVIVGISDYPTLGGGTDQKTNALGGQLAVCASTGAQIFAWLRENGAMAGRPVLSCRLLLAPGSNKPADDAETEAEFVEALTGGWHLDPSFEAISTSLRATSNDLIRTPVADTAKNAVFVYLAGHGLEVLASSSLLARDILDDTAQGPGNAIAYEPMIKALSTYGVGDGLFLFDCCRNAPEKAKENNIVGRSVLEPHPDRAVEAPRSMLYLKATRAADKAYQDPKSPRRATIFGQAVIEALEGMAPSYVPYDQTTTPWRLVFNNLESYVSQRVRDMLKDLGSTKPQTVVKGGEADSDSLILVAERAPVATGEAPSDTFKIEIATPTPGMVSMSEQRSSAITIKARGEELLANFRAEKRMAVTDAPRRVIDLANRRIMGPPLQSNAVTATWLSMIGANDARTGERLGPSALKLDAARLSKDGKLLWLDISVSPSLNSPLWLTLNRADAVENPESASMGIVVPRDENHDYPVRIEVAFDAEGLPGTLTGRLGPPDKRHPDTWHILWQAQRDALLLNNAESGKRLGEALANGLVEVVERKRFSPLAAAIAASALLQADRLEPLLDWPRNLTKWFPDLADGPVLWAETLMRRRRWQLAIDGEEVGTARPPWPLAAEPAEALEMLFKLEDRGPPLLAPVLAMAIAQTTFWLGNGELLGRVAVGRLKRISDRLLDIGEVAEPDTLFVSMRVSKADISDLSPYWL